MTPGRHQAWGITLSHRVGLFAGLLRESPHLEPCPTNCVSDLASLWLTPSRRILQISADMINIRQRGTVGHLRSCFLARWLMARWWLLAEGSWSRHCSGIVKTPYLRHFSVRHQRPFSHELRFRQGRGMSRYIRVAGWLFWLCMVNIQNQDGRRHLSKGGDD